jgi:hypothetical protein
MKRNLAGTGFALFQGRLLCRDFAYSILPGRAMAALSDPGRKRPWNGVAWGKSPKLFDAGWPKNVVDIVRCLRIRN